jgi:hypothetical protein
MVVAVVTAGGFCARCPPRACLPTQPYRVGKQADPVSGRIPTEVLTDETHNYVVTNPKGAPMFKTTLAIAIVSIGALGLTACDVKKTQEGDVTVPKFEVNKTQEGNVTLPKYDVTPPTVSVTTVDKTITVPTVKTEEKTIELPKVSVETGKEKNEGKK